MQSSNIDAVEEVFLTASAGWLLLRRLFVTEKGVVLFILLLAADAEELVDVQLLVLVLWPRGVLKLDHGLRIGAPLRNKLVHDLFFGGFIYVRYLFLDNFHLRLLQATLSLPNRLLVSGFLWRIRIA